MVDQLSPFLVFDEEYVVNQFKKTLTDHYVRTMHELTDKAKTDQKQVWRWGLGTINDSLKFPTSVAGSVTRTPGRYYELDYRTGKPDAQKPEWLQNTNEYIHASVRARYELGGLDATLKAPYGIPPALAQWFIKKESKEGLQTVEWKYINIKNEKDTANGLVLQEMPLGRLEMRLLEEDQATKMALFGSTESSTAGSSTFSTSRL